MNNYVEYVEHPLKSLFSVNKIVNARPLICDKNWVWPGEWHDCWELQYMAKGSVYVYLNNRFYKFQQGSLILFRPGSFHVVYGDGEQDAIMWVISFSADGSSLHKLCQDSFKVSGLFENLLRNIMDSVAQGYELSADPNIPELLIRKPNVSPFTDQLIQVLIEHALIRLLQSVAAPTSYAGRYDIQISREHEFLPDRIREYMLSHVEGRLSLEQVAQAFYVSTSLVKTAYKRRFGTSLIADYHHQKVERAKILLNQNDLSVTQIAFRLGFENPYYFSNFFKKHTGVSPSNYRDQDE